MLFTFSVLFAEAVWAALELEILVQEWELFPVFCGAGNFLCPTPGCWGLPVDTALGPPHWCGGWGKTCVGAVWDFCVAGVLQLGRCLPPVCFLACSFVYIKPSWKGAVLSSRASKRNINIYIQVERNVGMYWGLNPPGFCSAGGRGISGERRPLQSHHIPQPHGRNCWLPPFCTPNQCSTHYASQIQSDVSHGIWILQTLSESSTRAFSFAFTIISARAKDKWSSRWHHPTYAAHWNGC